MEKLFEVLSKRTNVAGKMVKYLQDACTEVESRKRNLDSARESVVKKMMGVGYLKESLEKRLTCLEEREKDFDSFREGKKRKLRLEEEEELSLRREEVVKDVKLKEERLGAELASVHEHIGWLEAAQAEVQAVRRRACERLAEIESQEQSLRTARESLAAREGKVDLVIESLDERIRVVEERENKFNLFLEGKMREVVLKEEELRMKGEEFAKEVKLLDEKFREREKLKERLKFAENKLEEVRVTIERFKKIAFRENLARESMEKQLQEFEKMKSEFNLFKEEKMREFMSKEQQLSVMSEELVKDAKLRDAQLIKREKKGRKLLKRLELAQDNVEELKKMVHERVKEIDFKEIELNSLRDWVEGRMDEVDSKAKEFEEQEKGIKLKEDNVVCKENELEEKKKELDLKEKHLRSWQTEVEVKQTEIDSAQELNEKRSGELDWREKSLDSVKEFTRSCFREHLSIKRQLRLERDLVEKRARDLEHKEQQLEYRTRELEYKEKQMGDYVKELEFGQQGLSNALNVHLKGEPDDSSDLKFVVKMDGKTLQMFLNDPEKDLELMGDEIFKVLHLSSDPAKLVLDAMEGFYPPHLRKGDVELNVRRTCILLLRQLIKISEKIRPCVREEAIKVASEWKSKMRTNCENSLEVLGFLHLLAAYNLASSFDKDEVLSFLKIVAEHRGTPELCHVLGCVEEITGIVFLSYNLFSNSALCRARCLHSLESVYLLSSMFFSSFLSVKPADYGMVLILHGFPRMVHVFMLYFLFGGNNISEICFVDIDNDGY
ncbi:hypothetical protein BUALT_Bualt02G0204600 [Buddleja alternifolia]|uniref:FRIGIDA-like protein n=1 Tax=Buddleja alternifolia TaxID=168488 RepID=A0AAV6Y322_9LAMI|nr:hypothetical protein BUALT_Bualt02G0204600 [Buddleja alternifolia]